MSIDNIVTASVWDTLLKHQLDASAPGPPVLGDDGADVIQVIRDVVLQSACLVA